MPSSERRARERADLRERIVAAATGVLVAEGAAALTMRRVASDMDYTAPVIYQHFANKDALIAEVVRQGYDELVGRLDAVQHAPDIDARLAGMAAEYLRFAGEHEHLFEAMNGTALSADERRTAAEPVIDVMWNLVDQWAQEHQVELEIGEACDIIWGTLYGIATLGHLDTFGEARAHRLGVHALNLLLQGWRSTT